MCLNSPSSWYNEFVTGLSSMQKKKKAIPDHCKLLLLWKGNSQNEPVFKGRMKTPGIEEIFGSVSCDLW